MVRINTFGCSYTHGCSGNGYSSWALELARMLPNCEVYNYGIGGTSLSLHTYLLEHAPRDKNTINILQITHAGRISWWDESEDFNQYLVPYPGIDNLQWFGEVRPFENHVIFDRRIGPTMSKNKTLEKNRLAEYYYGLVSYATMRFELQSMIYYAQQYSDYMFTHRRSQFKPHERFVNIDSFEEHTGSVRFEYYSVDDGRHFGPDGSRAEAKWIVKNLQQRGLIDD